MRGVVNGDTLRHVEPLQLTRLLKHGLPAAPRIAATKAELRRDCNSQVRPPDRLFGKHPPSCKVATSPATHPDRKSVVSGKSVAVRVDHGGRRDIKNTSTHANSDNQHIQNHLR